MLGRCWLPRERLLPEQAQFPQPRRVGLSVSPPLHSVALSVLELRTQPPWQPVRALVRALPRPARWPPVAAAVPRPARWPRVAAAGELEWQHSPRVVLPASPRAQPAPKKKKGRLLHLVEGQQQSDSALRRLAWWALTERPQRVAARQPPEAEAEPTPPKNCWLEAGTRVQPQQEAVGAAASCRSSCH